MDPLSDVLSLVKIHSYWSGGFTLGGAWSIAFGPVEGIKVYTLVSGQCWLSMAEVAEPVRVQTGDCLLLPQGRPFHLASDLALVPVDVMTLFPNLGDGGINIGQGGDDFLGIGSHLTLTGDHAHLLLGVLPPIVHIRQESDKAVLRWCVERMRQELVEPQPGGFLVAQQLATLVLIQVLRLYLVARAKGGVGWLFALADKRMRGAITAMHTDPAHRWTVQSLAEHVGMSRTTFAVRFRETVGQSPMDYLTHWRMQLAGDRLSTSGDPISVIASSLGYDSESAFSTAFKRVMGYSPRQCSRNRPALPAHGVGAYARLNGSAG